MLNNAWVIKNDNYRLINIFILEAGRKKSLIYILIETCQNVDYIDNFLNVEINFLKEKPVQYFTVCRAWSEIRTHPEASLSFKCWQP
jgi:hypothetical protein